MGEVIELARRTGVVHEAGGSPAFATDRWRSLADTARSLRGASLNDETDRLQAALDEFPMPASPATDLHGYTMHVLLANLLQNRLQLWCADDPEYGTE